MADVNANIGVNIDTSDALNQLKNLQRQISQFHQSVAKSSSAASIAQRDLQKNFVNSVNAIQGFSAELRTVRTSAESFTNSLEKNKFSIQQYFRYAASQTKTFGKNFASEFSTIEKTAIERVKTLQTQYVKMGRDANGAMQAIAIRPTVLDMKDLGTQTAIAAQKQVLFNQLIKQGSTNLLNFGKNTQWAGRQLMVGFTLPLATLGMTAGRVFMDMEKAAIKFKKVYGDLFTAPGETQKALDSVVELGLAYTKYGVAVSDTLSVASDAAAAGFQGVDLQNQTTASLKLSVLGQMELQKALETTIALQNAFRISSADLSSEIDFLNAVENQTVVSLDDITEAVPRVAPVIQSLGGDVKDLAFFLAAMKEGGVNAAQGANALKSGLASLINPTERASQMLNGMGINIRGIVNQNSGDLRGTVVEFAKALDRLEPMKRAQAIEQLFGKFQFARISALFDNVIKDGSQASRVLDLAGASVAELAALSDKELGVSAASAMNKFKAAVEQLKVALAPLGELFLEIATPFIDFATKVLDAFNNLPDGIKKIIGTVITVVGGLGPVLLMTFGLINNGIANMIKFFATVRLGYLKMTGQAKGIGDETQYMTQEQLEAAAAAASLDQAHSNLTQRFTVEKTAVDALRDAYSQAAVAGARFAAINPGMMKPQNNLPKFANGGFVKGPGTGKSDSIVALISNGEAIIPADKAKQYAPLIQGMIAGNIPGYAKGTGGAANFGAGDVQIADKGSARALQAYYNKLISLNESADDVKKMFADLVAAGEKNTKGQIELSKYQAEAAAEQDKNIKTRSNSDRDGSKTSLAHLIRTKDSSINPLTGEREGDSLVRRMFQSQNKQLDTGQSSEQFSQEWKSIKGGLNEALVVGGLELTEDVKVAAQKMDDEIHDAALALANGGEVNSEIVEKATNSLIEKYKSANGALGQVAKTMQALRDDPKHKVVLPPTIESMQKVGIAKPGESQKDVNQRQLREGLGYLRPTPTGQELIATEAGASLTTDPQRRLSRIRNNKNQNRPRRPATEKGATRQSTYLSMMGTSPEKFADLGVSIQAAEMSKVGNQLKKDAAVASPSKETVQASQGMVDGVTETLVNSKDDVAKATETMVSPVTQKRTGPRRASTDPAVMAALAGNQEVIQESRRPRRATREADSTAPTEKIWKESTENVSGFSNKISQAAFALSSVTGILSVFGADLGGIMPVISATTGALFGLIEISRLLHGTKLAEIAATRLLTAAKTQGAAGDIASAIATGNVANMFKTMFVKGQGFIGLLTNIGRAAMALFKGFGWIGLAITALTVGIPLVIKAFEDHANKINGLGAAANLTEEKLNFLAEKFGVTAKSINWAERAKVAEASVGKSTEEQKQVVDLMLDPEFEKEFTTEIAGIKNATKEQGELALQSLATQLRNSGFEDEAVNAVISAIAAKAERTDLELNFKPIFITDSATANAATDLAKQSVEAFNKEVAAQQTAIDQRNQQRNSDATTYNDGTETLNSADVEKETKAAAGVLKTSLDSLTLAFEGGNLSADVYSKSLLDLFDTLNSAEQPEWMLKELAVQMGLDDVIDGLTDAKDIAMLLQGAISGVEINEDDIKILQDAAKPENAGNEDLQRKANKIRTDFAKATSVAAAAQQKLNQEKAISNELAETDAEAEAVQAQIDGYNDLVASGMNAELAYRLVGDSARLAAFQQAQMTDATNGNTAAVDAFIANASRLDGLQKQFAGLNPVGGGGKKSDFQEAIDSLKEQQKEAKSSITAYAKLRSAGFGVAESTKIAKDSMLAAALASQQVGSKKWNELVAAIKAARAEEEAWLQSTPEGRAEHFADVYSKVMDVFNAQENIINMNNEAATATTKKIIKALEKQIDVYQRRSAELERDLDKIADKEEEINKKYDEKNKALETVKKLNQDILNQQKSQISVADALSQGDISGAAMAMEESKAQFAAAQGDATQRGLDASRQAELNSLTQNGKTRAEIEAEIKLIKKEIETIEFGALQNAKDMVEAADEIAEAATENLRVQGLSKTEWENINTRIDSSKANAALYDAEVAKALVNAQGLVGEWEKLNDTYTTTHVVNTTYTGTPSPKPTTPAATNPVRGAGGALAARFLAKGGMVKPAYFAAGGLNKGTDTVPAMLTPGEYVVNRASTKKFTPLLEAINNKSFKSSTLMGPKVPNNFSQPAYSMPARDIAGSMGISSASNSASSLTAQDNSVYNYSLSVNVGGTNASANDIANVVMNKIKTIESQQVRRQVLR